MCRIFPQPAVPVHLTEAEEVPREQQRWWELSGAAPTIASLQMLMKF